MDCHQSSQDVTSHTLESIVSKEETCECDREMERIRDSLTVTRVIEARPDGTVYEPRKEEEEVLWYIRGRQPGTWPELSECVPGETAVRGKEASEELGKTDCSP